MTVDRRRRFATAPRARPLAGALGVVLGLGVAVTGPAAAQDRPGGAGGPGVARAPVAAFAPAAATVPPRPAARAADSVADALAALPFRVGERLEYDVKIGPVRAGRGTMEVVGLERIRGRDALHLRLRLQGSALGFKVRYDLQSWVDPRSFVSLRHVQDQHEGWRGERTRRFELYPERATYAENGGEERPSVPAPLDEGSFVYWLRTVPLQVGDARAFDRYFRPDRNPVRVRVDRRETVKVPAGTFDALVLRPSIVAKGLFAEDRKAELWLSNDDRRVLVKMVTRLPVAGALTLELRDR